MLINLVILEIIIYMFLQSTPFKVLVSRYRLIIFSGLVVGLGLILFFLILSFVRVMPLEYRADAQVLIISQSRYGVDPYTAAKSAERVGENLIQVMKTDDFYQKVRAYGSSLDATNLDKLSERQRRIKWQKTVTASVVYGTGMLNISAYNKNADQAKAWAQAASEALSGKGWEYVGGDVVIKLVNTPVVSRFPVRPNLALNAVLGFVIGALGAGLIILKKYKIMT